MSKRSPSIGARVYWLAIWLGAGFVIPEFESIATGDPAGTLSWSIWWAMSIHPSIAFAVWGLIGWLAYHFTVDFARWRRRRWPLSEPITRD